MWGGNGADIFVFNANSGVDVIGDFTSGIDKIHISAQVFSSTSQAVTSFNDGVLNLFNGNIVTLIGVTTLGESDFVIV